jgi:hypothetical protein
MGRSGSDVAREAADIVLIEDNFADIVAGIEEGRAVFANVRKFMTYILTSNVPEIVPYLAFVLLGIPLPLTIVQILAVDLGTDILPALSLGAEQPDPDLMRRPPRLRRERLLDRGLLLRAYAFLGPSRPGRRCSPTLRCCTRVAGVGARRWVCATRSTWRPRRRACAPSSRRRWSTSSSAAARTTAPSP